MAQELKSFCSVLSNIHPGRDNRSEWAHIRARSAHIHHHCTPETFSNHLILLLQTFANITPGSSNCSEWHSIRQRCNALLTGFGKRENTEILQDFLGHLTTIYPGSDNIGEWNTIRSSCTNTLASLAANIQQTQRKKLEQQLAEEQKKNEEAERQRIAQQVQSKQALLASHRLLLTAKQNELLPLQQEYKCIEEQIHIQQQKVYPMDAVQFEGNMKFLVMLGITGDGKSTLCNRLCGDDSKKGNQGPFKAERSGESVTTAIQYKRCVIAEEKCIVVDCPGCDDSEYADVHHANNLSNFLCGIDGVDAFVLVQNGSNIRLKASLQRMIKEYEANFGERAFWSHLVIVLSNIEMHLMDELESIKQEFFSALNEKFANAKKYKIPIQHIGWYGYEFDEWRSQFMHHVKADIDGAKVLCDKMIPPLKKLELKKSSLLHRMQPLQSEISRISTDIETVNNEINQLQQ